MWVENMFAYICQSQFEPAGTRAWCPSLNFPNHRRTAATQWDFAKILIEILLVFKDLFQFVCFVVWYRCFLAPPSAFFTHPTSRTETLCNWKETPDLVHQVYQTEANSNVNEMLVLNPIPILAMTRELVLCSKCPKLFDIPKLIATHLFQCHQI